MSRSSAIRLLAAVALLLGLTAAMGAAPVAAHAGLETSTPAANSVLERGPDEIVLEFDEAIEADLASIRLFDGAGSTIELGRPTAGVDDTVVRATVPEIPRGLYAVIWRVTSADGHVVDGAFSFQVGTAATGDGQALIDRVSGDVRSASSVRWAYGVARFLALAGAIVLVGAGGWLLSTGTASARRTRVWVGAAWAALMVGSVAGFALFGVQAVAGTLGDVFSPSVWSDVAGTHTGRMLLMRILFAGALGAVLATRRHRTAGWWRGAAFVAALFLLYTFPAAGHPNALHPAALWIAIDLAHLAAVTVWIGGLFVVAFASRYTLAEPAGEQLARRFSTASAIAVPVVVLTGVVQTLKLSDGLDDITVTDWGRVLLTKVTLVVVLIAVAGVSRWLLRHDGAGSIVRTVRTEAVLGLVVVGLAAGMVGLPPTSPPKAQTFAEQLSANGLIAVISLSPGRVGGNEVHVVLTPPGGSITPVTSATARISLPDAEVPFSPIDLVRDGPNHYSGPVTFPRAGDWAFELLVQVTDTETVLLKTTIPIP